MMGASQEEGGGHRLFKLLIGFVEQSGWTSPIYPNRTTTTCCFDSVLQNPPRPIRKDCPRDDPCPPAIVGMGSGVTNCSSGCLFELRSDPSESVTPLSPCTVHAVKCYEP
jgi:hypothetical protein